MSGVFITFEGPDGAGKTTQIHRLAKRLKQLGKSVVMTREPGGTAIGNEIRSLLLSPEHKAIVNETEILLYAASRAQHVREFILPALEQGSIVLCDRFVDASIAYQAYGLGMDVEQVEQINRFATAGLIPTRTYLLDIPVEEGRRRLLARSAANPEAMLDRIEQKSVAYHEKVRSAFLKIASHHRDRICLIDARQDEQELERLIFADYETSF